MSASAVIPRIRSRAGPRSPAWRFNVHVVLVWAGLLAGLLLLFGSLGLDFRLIGARLPSLLGLRLTPTGFVQGAALTVVITVCAMMAASVIGILVALGRVSANPVAFGLAAFYASLFRGTPLLVQVLIIYLALPQVGIVLGAFASGVLALSLNYGAYLAETVRSGLLAVPAGQREAARALGLGSWPIASRVVMPQAIRVIIPPAGAQFVSLLKDSSLVSVMGLWELNFLAQAYGRATFRYMEMLVAAAAIYWLMSIGLEVIQARLERRYGRFAQEAGR